MTFSYQLYSSRNAPSWDGVIADLARFGIENVEGFGAVYDDPGAFRALLDRHGMAMPSGHVFPLGTLEAERDETLAVARTLGMSRLICPAPEDPWRDGADAEMWIALARRLEEVAKAVNDAGFRFGWHNHDWEFRPLETGEVPMALILEHAPSIEWEMDVAWVVRAGADPMAWIAAEGARITAAHVKDIAPPGEGSDEDGWAALGDGVLDWAGLLAALRGAGTDLFVLEHDNPRDPARYAETSIAALRRLWG